MPTDTKLKELIINELTEEQYKALTPNDDELYLTPDGSITKNENGSYVFNGLEVKSNGDVTVGKNLEVDGNVFTLNGKQWGIMPVKSVDDNENYSDMGFILSNILPHTSEDNRINVSGIWFNIANNYIKYCMSKSKYLTPGYTKTHINDGVLYISTHDIYKLEELFNTFLSSDYVSRMYQPKLYRHNLLLNNKYWKEYITDNNLKANTIQDLDTITHSKNGTTLVLGAENQLLLIKQGATWKIGAETITTVSDDVTTL